MITRSGGQGYRGIMNLIIKKGIRVCIASVWLTFGKTMGGAAQLQLVTEAGPERREAPLRFEKSPGMSRLHTPLMRK